MGEDTVDQSILATDINDKVGYTFRQAFLVKPLELTKVKKEFSKPIAKDSAKKDDNDVEAVDYDEVETEVKEVDSDYRKGIIISIPYSYAQKMADDKYPSMQIKVGDTITYKANQGVWFDLLKDSQLVDEYSIVAVEA